MPTVNEKELVTFDVASKSIAIGGSRSTAALRPSPWTSTKIAV